MRCPGIEMVGKTIDYLSWLSLAQLSLALLTLPNNQFFTTLQNDGSLENITQYIEGVFISSIHI